MTFRIGLGIDSHAFETQVTEKAFLIGGVEIPSHLPVQSHSDGDVVLHSIFNALSSAIGEKSIGQFFPDTAEENKGKDSREFIRTILRKVREKNFLVENVVFSLECKTPKIAPIEMKIKQNVAALLNISPDAVAVHATTGEGLTSFGQGKGLYCQCVLLLQGTH